MEMHPLTPGERRQRERMLATLPVPIAVRPPMPEPDPEPEPAPEPDPVIVAPTADKAMERRAAAHGTRNWLRKLAGWPVR